MQDTTIYSSGRPLTTYIYCEKIKVVYFIVNTITGTFLPTRVPTRLKFIKTFKVISRSQNIFNAFEGAMGTLTNLQNVTVVIFSCDLVCLHVYTSSI